MKIDLSCIPIESILLTKDYCEGEYGFSIDLTINEKNAELEFIDPGHEKIFTNELGDFIKRLAISEKTREIKEIIIGRALYGIVEKC